MGVPAWLKRLAAAKHNARTGQFIVVTLSSRTESPKPLGIVGELERFEALQLPVAGTIPRRTRRYIARDEDQTSGSRQAAFTGSSSLGSAKFR